MNESEKYCYDDIINLPHHVSQKHPRMDLLDRAAQFAPFAALTGHEAAIRETERLTEQQIELSESQKQSLDEKLWHIKSRISEIPSVKITFFEPDIYKSGGSYITITDKIKKIDEYEHCIILNDNTAILLDRIVELEEDVTVE